MSKKDNKTLSKATRFTPREWQEIKRLARAKNMPPSAYMRECALHEAPREMPHTKQHDMTLTDLGDGNSVTLTAITNLSVSDIEL